MRTLVMLSVVLTLTACAKKEPGPSAGSGSATAPAPAPPPVVPDAAAPDAATAAAPANDGADEVAQLVVAAVGSNALGKQVIEPSCVSVAVIPAGDWTVAAARLKDCGDKNARSILWVFKRAKSGKWNEDYAAQPPKCWKGIPPDIADAVAKATKIPNC